MEGNARQSTEINLIANEICKILLDKLSVTPEFADSPVPMSIASKVLKMDPDTIRNRMENGSLDIGIITTSPKKRGKRTYRNAYISPIKFWKLTGYIWRGENK